MKLTAQEYVDILTRDERGRIVSETPTIYEETRIERVYEIDDGAVVKYEWLSPELNGDYNHRFTLVKPPDINPKGLKPGVLSSIPAG